MKIGIIGPRDSAENIAEKLSRVDESIECKFYIREEISKVGEVIDRCEDEVDGIILTGAGVHATIEGIRPLTKPFAYIHRNTLSLVSTLWKAREDFKDLSRFSVDVVSREAFTEAVEELNLPPDTTRIMPFCSSCTEEDYIKWHTKLFKEGETDFILTGFGDVYTRLKREGYPVYRLFPTYSQVKEAYREILHKAHISKLKSSQIAVQVIKVTKKINKNYYEELNIQNKLQKEIISYVRDVQGALYTSGGDEYVITGTRGSFKDSIKSFMKLLSNVVVEISSGIGYGSTAYEADVNARNALLASIREGGLFVIDECGTLRRPVGPGKVSGESRNKKIEIISEVTKLSPVYISKIMTLLERKEELRVDSRELAGYLEISERSARRIITKLIENNYGSLETEEKVSKGRPKNIIKITF